MIPIFITLTGESSGDKIRIQVQHIVSFLKQSDATGLLMSTDSCFVVREKPDEVETIIGDAISTAMIAFEQIKDDFKKDFGR